MKGTEYINFSNTATAIVNSENKPNTDKIEKEKIYRLFRFFIYLFFLTFFLGEGGFELVAISCSLYQSCRKSIFI